MPRGLPVGYFHVVVTLQAPIADIKGIVNNPSDHAEAIEKLVAALGGQLVALYMTTGGSTGGSTGGV